jgi:hypothetical protein
MSKGSFTFSMVGETTVGKSEAPGAFETEMRRRFGDDRMVVLDCREVGVPGGHIGRLIGHPQGYRTYGDDRTPPEGLLAMLALGRKQQGEQPCILLDGGDCDREPLAN